jgi:predicted dehydrogenase
MKEARTLVDLAKRARLTTAYFENQIFMKAIAAQREQLKPSMDAMGAPVWCGVPKNTADHTPTGSGTR